MWRIIIIAVLASAAAGAYKPQLRSQLQLAKDEAAAVVATVNLSTSTEASSRPTSSSSSSSTALLMTTTTPAATPQSEISSSAKPAEEPASATPSEEQAIATSPRPSTGDDCNLDASKRRIITYDQRQEGQYNIRADLENFMIVLIPPTPAEGINLLDLLSKSTFRHSSASHSNTGHSSKPKRRHGYVGNSGAEGGPRYQQTIKTGNNNQNFNYVQRNSENDDPSDSLTYSTYHHQHNSKQQPVSHSAIILSPTSEHFQDFIEGRTPFHVEISASDSEHSRQPERQVDVLPPSYPLGYQHLIRPFHLDAEPTVIQALPPAGLTKDTQGAKDFLESYNQLLAASNFKEDTNENSNSNSKAHQPRASDFYRVSRAIRGEDLLDTNSVTSSNSLLHQGASSEIFSSYARSAHLPIFRSDLSFGAGSRYPPIDVPRLSDYLKVGSNSRTMALNSADEREMEEGHVGEIIVPAPIEDELDLDLNSAGFMDSEAKGLLSDGMERCAPGRRRDSYGVCREIEGY